VRTKIRFAAGLLDQSCITQCLKDAIAAPSHVVRDREDKAGAVVRAAPAPNVGELGKSTLLSNDRMLVRLWPGRRHGHHQVERCARHAAEHFFGRFDRFAIRPLRRYRLARTVRHSEKGKLIDNTPIDTWVNSDITSPPSLHLAKVSGDLGFRLNPRTGRPLWDHWQGENDTTHRPQTRTNIAVLRDGITGRGFDQSLAARLLHRQAPDIPSHTGYRLTWSRSFSPVITKSPIIWLALRSCQ
jgi:hypothetical protein